MPLTPAEIEILLREPLLAHIAVACADGRPHVTPIWIAYEKGSFYFTTRLRRVKGRTLQRTSYAAISIATNERPYRAVIVEGKVEQVKSDRDAWLLRIAKKYGEAEGERWFNYSRNEPDRVVMKLVPIKVLSWHYGRGDYSRQNQGESMETHLPVEE